MECEWGRLARFFKTHQKADMLVKLKNNVLDVEGYIFICKSDPLSLTHHPQKLIRKHRRVFKAWFLTLLNQAIGNIQETFKVKIPCKILCTFISEWGLKVWISCIGFKVCDILGRPQTVSHLFLPSNHLEPEVYIFNRLGAEERKRSLQCV